jgi:flagella basal body P-ring formation protein FlgA
MMNYKRLTHISRRHTVPASHLRHGLLTPLLVAICCLFGTSPAAQAKTAFESPARLMLTAKQYIHARYAHKYDVSVDFGYLDSRLHLAQCQQPLEAFFPPGLSNLIATSVGIRCGQPNWQVYIPVNIHAYTMVLTASRPLARNTVLAANDLKLRKREISQYRSGVFADKQELVGMVLKRPLAEGSVVTPREVAPKQLVRRGEPVIIMAQSNGMMVRVQGKALMDGHHGEMIRVRNTRSGRKLVAEVIGTSTVMVKM